jgi:peptidoglycan hydrolase-like protein with peptidoglycan-binding domain
MTDIPDDWLESSGGIARPGHLDPDLRARVRAAAADEPPLPPSVRAVEARLNEGSWGAPPDFARRRLIVGMAAAAAFAVGGFALSRRASDDEITSADDGAALPLPPSSIEGDAWPVASTAVSTALPVDSTVPLTRTIGDGMAGDDVKMVQSRLKELALDPGEIDGIYGLKTRQASWAFQKLVNQTPRTQVSDELTNELWLQMAQPVAIAPRRTDLSETHVEVYLPEQVLVVFNGDVPKLITHISSGTGEDWCEVVTLDPGEQGNEDGTDPLEKGICGKSITTGGTFVFNRRFVEGDGWREGSLGRMFKPVYFNYGLAVHGSGNVPNAPASHGCIRTPMHVADYFPDLVAKGDDIWIWDGAKEPQIYGPQQPYFDRRDPDWIPPTTTTTSTTTTSTTVPSSSVPATTTPVTTTPAPPASSVAPSSPPATTIAVEVVP